MKKRILTALLLCFMIFGTFSVNAEEVISIYVSPNGSDSNPGSEELPVKTAFKAKELASARKDRGKKRIEVIFREGNYLLEETLSFGPEDSGSESFPIEYKAYGNEKVYFDGGFSFPEESIKKLENSEMAERFPEEVRDKILCVDLSEAFIDKQIPENSRIDHLWVNKSGPLMAYFGTDKMTQARWPNEGEWTQTGKIVGVGVNNVAGEPSTGHGTTFTYLDDRIEKYKDIKNVWMYGRWMYDWAPSSTPIASIDTAKKTITTRDSNFAGYTGSKPYYYYDVPEELDIPGEYYIDRETKQLYFLPPETDNKTVYLTFLESPIIEMNNAHDIQFRNITFQGSRQENIVIKSCRRITVQNCVSRFSGFYNMDILGENYNIYIDSNEIYESGGGGIQAEGGDIKCLKDSGIFITNNHIYNFATYDTTGHPAIRLTGYHVVAANNTIHGGEHLAIAIAGASSVVEYNEIYDVLKSADDAAVIYMYNNGAAWNATIRNNYIHHSSEPGLFKTTGCWGIYLDGRSSGLAIYENIFNELQGGVFINLGGNVKVHDNLFINTPYSLRITQSMHNAQIATYWSALSRNGIDYTKGLWKYNFPEIYENISKGLDTSVNIRMNNNLLYNTLKNEYAGIIENTDSKNRRQYNNIIIKDDIFANKDAADFRITGKNPIEGFKETNMDMIGTGGRSLEEIIGKNSKGIEINYKITE